MHRSRAPVIEPSNGPTVRIVTHQAAGVPPARAGRVSHGALGEQRQAGLRRAP